MGFWGNTGLGLLGLVVIGAIAKNTTATQPTPAQPPKTEEEQALERCTVAMWTQYSHGSVSGPGGDVWKVKKTGGIAALYTVRGRNSFGMPVLNTVECEESRDRAGGWNLPFLWNVTMHDDRLDPSSLDESSVKRPRRKAAPKTSNGPEAKYDESGAETVNAEGSTK